ncbi:MAG: ABC transporter ATP-binding protein [Cyanobacteria bacterium]|nr:ABC transporter ATP-binding protein [Cyanobacteriota bacterium]MDW8202313.1 ABC transporter ATP-binding protein [Cyanobacteriota bacterium SKYGB_h_bin112]
MSEVIQLENVSLWRRTQEEFSYDLKRTILSLLEGKLQKPSKKLVLDQINLTVNAGERIGFIGSNGAGKSTLLKVICGILEPTCGRVKTRGTIAPLIELGVGFDVENSVLNNIIYYGVFLGFSRKDMERRTQSILEFAELEDYAYAPIKALSSGMVSRLGFAVATEVQPDILILDEVFSVGDASFVKKCQQRMQRFWQSDTTILLVSHNLEFIQANCQRAVWLDRGRIRFQGAAQETVQRYLDTVG